MNVQEEMDRLPLGRYHYMIAALCAASVFMDGYDAQAMGFVAPALRADWHVTQKMLGPVLTSGIAGMLGGALVFGPLADKFGRKAILVFCTLWFGIWSIFTSQATDVNSLILIRLITGLGLGGTLPNAIALTSEFMPRRLRATGVMLMFSGFSVGAAVGGVVAAGIIQSYGWKAVFVVGGILPCIAALFLLALPESVRFLVLKGGEEGRIAKYLSKLGIATSVGTKFTVTETKAGGFSVGELFRAGRAKMTPILWVIFFMSLLDLYFLNSWLPTIISDAGIAQQTAILVTAMFQLGGSVGAWVLGRFFDSKASYQALAAVYFGAAICVALIGFAGTSVALLTAIVFLSGFFVIGGQTGSNSLVAESYPTAIRSTGVGWALGIGRIGSIVGPYFGGMLLTPQVSVKQVFWAAAVPPLIATIAVWALNSMRTPRAE